MGTSHGWRITACLHAMAAKTTRGAPSTRARTVASAAVAKSLVRTPGALLTRPERARRYSGGAARGRIRRCDCYIRHVRARLASCLAEGGR